MGGAWRGGNGGIGNRTAPRMTEETAGRAVPGGNREWREKTGAVLHLKLPQKVFWGANVTHGDREKKTGWKGWSTGGRGWEAAPKGGTTNLGAGGRFSVPEGLGGPHLRGDSIYEGNTC